MLPTLDRHRPFRLATVCALYMAQGMPDGFVRVGLKTYLIDQGVSTDSVGNVVALVSWPWALKWIWGPIIDRYRYSSMGRRRPWILVAQTGMALTLGTMIMIPDLASQLTLLGIMVLLVNVCGSLQDVSVDALAVDLLPEKERGITNGFMFGSSYLGSYLGAAVIGGLLITSGIRAAISVQMLILFAIALFPLLLRERQSDSLLPRLRGDGSHSDAPQSTIRELYGKLGRAFSVRSSWLAGVFALSSLFAISSHLVFWPVHLQRVLGWSTDEYLQLEGNYAVWFALAGSILGGIAASVFGAKKTVALSLIVMVSIWLAHAACEPYWSNARIVTILFLLASGFAGFLQVAMFALFMGIAWPPVAATQFTAYMAMLNLSNGVGAKLAGRLEAAFSMQGIFVVLAVYQLATLFILWPVDPHETRRKLGES